MATTQTNQAAADYEWLSRNLPQDISPAFGAVFRNLGINAGYIATEAGKKPAQQPAQQPGKGGRKKADSEAGIKTTPAQLLTVLKRNSGGLTIQQLAEKTGSAPARLGTLLKRGTELRGKVEERDGKWFATTETGGGIANIGESTTERAGPPTARDQGEMAHQQEEQRRTGTTG